MIGSVVDFIRANIRYRGLVIDQRGDALRVAVVGCNEAFDLWKDSVVVIHPYNAAHWQ